PRRIPARISSTATAPTERYTLSLHDALPISLLEALRGRRPTHDAHHRERLTPGRGVLREALRPGLREADVARTRERQHAELDLEDRKSTRLNSSHVKSSYAVFCLKKKRISAS